MPNLALVTGLREAPREWVRRLREIDPIRDAVSYLELVWDANSERWWLFEMVPAYDVKTDSGRTEPTVPLEILAELKGVDPSTIPETAPLISRRQWLLYGKTGRWARPCWVIQGTKGGHPYAFDAATVKLCQYLEWPTKPPESGMLPYAEFDERVVTQILRMSKLWAVRNDLDAFRRDNMGAGGKASYNARLKEARALQMAHLEEQFDEAAEYFVSAYRKGEYDSVGAPVSETDWAKKDEIATNNYVDHGSFDI